MGSLPPQIANTNLLTLLLCSVIGYVSLVFVYRLFFHPLASFPGPRLAAVTSLYQIYYDVCKGGEFLHHIKGLHEVYGVFRLYDF
jgi:hypothetical protein